MGYTTTNTDLLIGLGSSAISDATYAYAQNLKVIGKKREALAVLQQASLIHGTNRELAADYGRLALELRRPTAPGNRSTWAL